MYCLVPPECDHSFRREYHRQGMLFSLWAYPLFVVVCTPLAYVSVSFFAGRLVRAFFQYVLPGVPDHRQALVLFLVLFGCVALALALFFWKTLATGNFSESRYCGACHCLDLDETGICPSCGNQMRAEGTFFFTNDEKNLALAKSYGLIPMKNDALGLRQDESPSVSSDA